MMNNSTIPPNNLGRPAGIELLRAASQHKTLTAKQTKQLNEYLAGPPDSKDAFIIKRAADWMKPVKGKKQQPGGKLFDHFWYAGELCIMFADTNVGKSILAVQIADSLSRGEAIPGFGTARPTERVLYFDFELTAAQFEKRYSSDDEGIFPFTSNFYRLVFNPDSVGARRFASYADYLNNGIENVLVTTKARVLIIDNITCLRSGTEAAASAVSLMKNLQTLKNKYGLSILVLAHTPKRNPAKPVTRNDLQGSKMLINFADSAFAIGESQTSPGLRYFKQIKQRSGIEVFGANNVALCRMVKPANFLHFEFTGFGPEAAHLQHYTEQQRKVTEERIAELNKQGLSVRHIAAETGISFSTVHRVVRRLGKV
jgi:hypothetical protein